MTVINARPRIDLLRCLAASRDFEMTHPELVDEFWPTHVPLFGAVPWSHAADDMVLAAKELASLGHVEMTTVTGQLHAVYGYMLRLTDAGYNHIKAHDAIGEAEQEVPRGAA